jgi:DNA-binding CsgD family transcriptional regulator
LGSLLAATALVGSPALAAKRAVRHTVSCKQINEAIASGKSAEDVAKDLNVSSARVKSCAAPAARHHHRRAAGKSS